ncbi:MAG: adenylate/guanylate cyclase domain-containing protein [Rhodospirillales bacterium]
MTPVSAESVQELSDWMIANALVAGIGDYQSIFEAFCERLYDCGVPLFRAHVASQTLHPLIHAVSLTWYRGEKAVLRQYSVTSSPDDDEGWRVSPLKALIDRGETSVHYRFDHDFAALDRYPVLRELAAKGATGYFGVAINMAPGGIDERLRNQSGLIASFSTDRPGGFTAEHIAVINRILPRFALISKLANREQLLDNVLNAYLGQDAGRRVREGQISLGSGQMINAVIWFCDLRNSTPLAESLGHERFLALLNDYFGALAGAVMDNGGEVLRFIGDAALAIFPIADDAYSDAEARKRAVKAARDALGRAAAVNAERAGHGDEPFEFGIGLHAGEIMYGNIGVPSRVEFSVIGAAANEAARIEGLCKAVGEPVLVSASFVEGTDLPWRDLGRHAIRGSEREMHLFGLPA